MSSDPLNMKTARKLISGRDYDGIILDMLDDIVSAEQRAKRLVDRIDVISKQGSLRVVDIDSYCWLMAAIAVGSFFSGSIVGYVAHFWLKTR